jgi:hypothetical protein
MFQAKDGKKFGSAFAGKNYDEKHSPTGMHKLGGEEPHELGQDKMGEGAKSNLTKPGSSDNAMSRTDSEGEAKNIMADTNVDQGEQKGMNQEEGSPEESADPAESRTDEQGEATNEDVVPDDVKSDAQAHGAASKVTVTHDHTAGRHMVTSQHKDGHLHSSEHKTAGAAHASARHLGGVMPKAAPKAAPEPEDDEYSHLLN